MDQDTIYALIPIMAIACGMVAIIAKTVNNMIAARHGYPITGENGTSLARLTDETKRETALLSAENDRLKSALLRVEERVSVLERIATDSPARLAHEIEALR